MNKTAVIAAVIAAVAIGIVVGVIGTAGDFSSSTQSNSLDINTQPEVTQQNANKLSGSVTVDGSSTVYPITEVIAEKFSKTYPDVKTTVAISGTGGGFKRFVVGETDINDASRPITEGEKTASTENNVRWVGIPVALEGLSIVVHPDNSLLPNDCISIEQLKEMWKPDRTVTSWSDLDPSNPDQKIRLYGAGPDSGTFDYFTERVVGQARSSTTDYNPSEDDNVLVQGVENDRYALGYIPLAYVAEAGDRLKILTVSDGGDCVFPDSETVTTGEYPLARPLFIYVNYDKLQSKPELQTFVEFYLSNAKDAVEKVQYVTLQDTYYPEALAALKEGKYTPNDDQTFNALYK
jgi:phosphate transport system substrate-binding protein